MTTAALDQAYKCVGEIADGFTVSATNDKVSTALKVFKIVTNKESVESSGELLSVLNGIKEALPTKDEDVDIQKCKQHLQFANEHLTELNTFQETLDKLFGEDGAEVQISEDDETVNVYQFLANMQHANETLAFIAEYLTLVLKIQKNKSEPEKEYSYQSFMEFLAA